MRLPSRQPQRSLVVLLVYLVLGAAGAVALVLLRGPFLGGVLAVMWLEVLAVPLAVLAFDKSRDGG